MRFIGSLIGGVLGLVAGSFLGIPFLGLIIGSILGSSFVVRTYYKNYKTEYRGWQWEQSDTNYYQKKHQFRQSRVFFESLFTMLGSLAAVDGQVNAIEIQTVKDFMNNDLRLNQNYQAIALQMFHNGSRNVLNFEPHCHRLYFLFKGQPAILQMVLTVLYKLAESHDGISSEERRYLDMAESIFRMKGSTSYNSGYTSTTELESAYNFLGCNKEMSDEDVKKKYRKMASEFHPDRAAAKGLPKEFIAMATEKFQKVQNSYDTIKVSRGIK